MYAYTWIAHSVFDDEEDLTLMKDVTIFESRDDCIKAAFLNKPLTPIGYFTIVQIDHFVKKAQHPEYIDYTDRLSTYSQWPRYHLPRPETLTKAGLFYTHTGDTVSCFQCGVTLADWQTFDDPLTRHAEKSKNCAFVISNGSVKQRNLDTL